MVDFDWGFAAISDPALKRQAFEAVTEFSMSGIAFLLSCVFGSTPLELQMQGSGAPYVNSGDIGPQKADDRWYTDLIIGLASVTDGINDIIQGAVGTFNSVIDTLNAPTKWLNEKFGLNLPLIPQVTIDPLLLPDVPISNYVGEASYDGDGDFPHWRGKYDSRVGMESRLSAVNAYGKVLIPFFELLNLKPMLSETDFNASVTAVNAGALMQSGDKTALCAELHRIAATITQALTTPLLDWLAPIDDAKVPESLGYSPMSKALDLLPNLAFVTENDMISTLLNDILDGLTLDVTLHLGGIGGAAVQELQQNMTEYTTENYFEINYFLALFGNILPSLLNWGPLLNKILEAASIGAPLIFAQPIIRLVELQATDYDKLLLNRNDGSGGEDDFLTVLEGRASTQPGDGVRSATLGSLIGFFAGESAANSLNFNLFGETGLPLGKQIVSKMTAHVGQNPKTLTGWLQNETGLALGGSLTELLNSIFVKLFPEDDEPANEQMTDTIKTAAKNPAQLEGFLVELFNPQTYPATDFIQYALLDKANSADPRFNPVQYSDKWNAKWTAKKANYLAAHLDEFLDNLTQYLIGRDFALWLQEQLSSALGFDVNHPYNAQNINALLDKISEWLGGWDFGDVIRQKADLLPDDDREAFTALLCEALQPLAPTLKICLTGGRENGATKAGGNLTWLEDTLGFSGYDGYKHGLIPIYEHLGVTDIPTYEEFLAKSTDPASGDAAFFAMLIDPLLDRYEYIMADPLHNILELLPNVLYFFAAKDGENDNFSPCINRLLRPVNAALDMVTPMLPSADAFALLGIPYPIRYDLNGKQQELTFPVQISGNDLLIDMLQGFIGEFSDKVGLNITLTLSDMTDLVSGTLKLYTSKSGQTDAVLLESTMPDLLTNLLRKLIVLIFTDENYAEFRRYIEERLPDNKRKLSLGWLDACAKTFKRTLNKSDGVDRVLNQFYGKAFAVGVKTGAALWFRDLWSKIRVWWFTLLSNSKLAFIRQFAEWRLDQLKDNYITLEGGFHPNGVLGARGQFWDWLGKTMPWLRDFILAVFRWFNPIRAVLLG